MTADPRGALDQLITAFERHLEASASKSGEDDPAVVAAYDDLADAFAAYDDALLGAYGEMTPLDIYDGEDDEDDEELDDHSDEDGDGAIYSGLDDDEYDDESDDEGDDESDDAGGASNGARSNGAQQR